MLVEMLEARRLESGEELASGQIVRRDDREAGRWIKAGIAKPAAIPEPRLVGPRTPRRRKRT